MVVLRLPTGPQPPERPATVGGALRAGHPGDGVDRRPSAGFGSAVPVTVPSGQRQLARTMALNPSSRTVATADLPTVWVARFPTGLLLVALLLLGACAHHPSGDQIARGGLLEPPAIASVADLTKVIAKLNPPATRMQAFADLLAFAEPLAYGRGGREAHRGVAGVGPVPGQEDCWLGNRETQAVGAHEIGPKRPLTIGLDGGRTPGTDGPGLPSHQDSADEALPPCRQTPRPQVLIPPNTSRKDGL